MAKYGLEPYEFEELTIRRFYQIIFQSENLSVEPPSSGNIRKRIQDCIKKYMQRQNIGSPDKMDQRRSTANKSAHYTIRGGGDDKDKPSPRKLQEDTSGKQGAQKTTNYFHELYHEAERDLFKRENILTDEYAINKGGRLEKNGKAISHEDFLDFIKENLTVRRIRELPLISPTQTRSADPEKQEFVDILVVAFTILELRYWNEMAIGNDRKVEREKQNWQNHVDVIVEIAVYIAVLDEIYHKKWQDCGIKYIVEDIALLLPTDFPL